MNKLLCIVGPTATGKTKKALALLAKQPSILVSADSRQLYRGMSVVTGKDHPKNIKIYGIDIVNPDQPCSVSVWYDTVMPPIRQAWVEGKLPIIVGGTGLYVRALTHGIATIAVPIDQPLRDELSVLSLTKLQDRLKSLDTFKFESMNHSDQNNPRRLIRAIEIYKDPFFVKPRTGRNLPQTEIIGLKYSDLRVQREKITQRVLARLEQGAISETEKLLAKYPPSLQSMSAIGYRSIIQYLEGKLTKDQMIDSWVADELSYAKRQLTWFRPTKNIKWYDVDTIVKE